MNYYISYEWREQIIDELMQEVFGLEEHLASRFYLALDQVRQMHDAGMVIGSHSVTHPVFSKLPITSQEAEIKESFEFLQNITGAPIRTFCYPHGGRHTFSLDTERLLEKYGCDVSFAVEPREITQNDLISQPQALPRHDCNLFPFGQASMGLNKAQLIGSDPPQISNQ
jgi:hypothetical protein